MAGRYEAAGADVQITQPRRQRGIRHAILILSFFDSVNGAYRMLERFRIRECEVAKIGKLPIHGRRIFRTYGPFGRNRGYLRRYLDLLGASRWKSTATAMRHFRTRQESGRRNIQAVLAEVSRCLRGSQYRGAFLRLAYGKVNGEIAPTVRRRWGIYFWITVRPLFSAAE